MCFLTFEQTQQHRAFRFPVVAGFLEHRAFSVYENTGSLAFSGLTENLRSQHGQSCRIAVTQQLHISATWDARISGVDGTSQTLPSSAYRKTGKAGTPRIRQRQITNEEGYADNCHRESERWNREDDVHRFSRCNARRAREEGTRD